MANINLTAELLDAQHEKVNLALLFDASEEAWDCAIRSIEFTLGEYDLEAIEKNLGIDANEEIEINGEGLTRCVARETDGFLESALPELFGEDGPITLEGFLEQEFRMATGMFGQEQNVFMHRWSIDGRALKDLAAEYGVTSVDDGLSTSGFIRTASDSYWAQLSVIRELMWHMDEDLTLLACEYFNEDSCEYVNYGRIEERL